MKTLIKTNRIFLATAVILILFAGCKENSENAQRQKAPVNVTVALPTVPEGEGFFSASGQIEAEQYARISTRLMGYVSRVHVKVGEKVRKGQLLIHINSDEIEAKRAQTQAGLNQAMARFASVEKDYNRFKELYAQNSASQKEMDDMTSQYEIAKAQVESAKQMQNEVDAIMSYSNIRAPFSGVITSENVKMGDMANPGQTLMTLEAPGEFVATAMVPETDIADVKKGSDVKVYIKSSGISIAGKVSEVSSSSQYSGGQYLVKISLEDQQDLKLYSGMFVSTLFPTEKERTKNILIPQSALVHRGELEGVYTLSSSNTALLRWLKLGRVYGDQVEVLSGLKEGERFIISSEGKLFNGVQLNIKE